MYNPRMEWLNYHHLLYFWTVAKEGTIAAACEKLHLTQPTISTQIRALEEDLGTKLFKRVGRNLVLTETGQVVCRYADEIFSLGHEMMDVLSGRPAGSALSLNVGVAEVVPKLVAYRLLEPAISLPTPVRAICHEGSSAELIARLSVHELDLVLSDAPVTPDVRVRAFSHLLGECGVSFFGTAALAEEYNQQFPRCLDGAPFLFPTDKSASRRTLDQWFDSKDIHPIVVGEFDDSALLKVFGQGGAGLFAVPTVIEKEVAEQYGVQLIGRSDKIRERFYAISLERKVKHPAVSAIADAARGRLFG
jgi:LysR family transcriptional regulator, transcriptional activator of nhaA